MSFVFGEYDQAGHACFKDRNGSNVIIYSVNAMNSSLLESSNLQLDIINDGTLGGYVQIINDVSSDALTRQVPGGPGVIA